jgi:GTP-binding protein HflX
LPERAILVALEFRDRRAIRPELAPANPTSTAEEPLAELAALASTAGAQIAGRLIQSRPAPEAATLIGSGKVRELKDLAEAAGAELVIFDNNLSPTQQRNLEKALEKRVIDRTQLILDIFAARARTREGQLQVELAQLDYLLPRLAGRGLEMSRLGGGIGTRGPGETQLETDRRRIARRMRTIRAGLETVRAHRSVQRKQRQGVPLATAVLVGYANAGKSTLFNRLTGAGVAADSRLFATLDPTIRSVTLPSHRRVLASDTVGFIRDLPPSLIQAFRATLEEVTEAALLLHVVDAASPSVEQQAADVQKVLAELGCEKTPQLFVVNKVDLLSEPAEAMTFAGRLTGGNIPAVAISARTGEGIKRLMECIDELLPAEEVSLVRFRFPAGEGWPLHLLHEFARVISTRYEGDRCVVEAEAPSALRRRLAEYLLEN